MHAAATIARVDRAGSDRFCPAMARFVRARRRWGNASGIRRGLIGLVVLLVVGVVFTWTAPTASALVPPDLVSSVNAVQAGDATPAQTEVYESYVDWVEQSYGVSDAELSFQNIEQADGSFEPWSGDPVVANLEAAYNAAPAGGGTEAATGADLLGAAEDIGAAGSAESGIAVALGGICASTVGCGLVGAGIAATIVVGPKIMSYYFPSANQALANDASSGTCPSGTSGNLSNGCGLDVPSQAKRIWCATVTQGVSDVYGTYGGGAWTGLNVFAHDGGGDGCLTAADYSSLGLRDMTSIPNVGGGMDFNDTGTTPCPGYSLCVPTDDISHGGIWLLAMDWPSGWSWGSSAYATAGDTSQCSPETWNGYAQTWTVPPPGSPGATSGWDRVDLAANDGNSEGCFEVNGQYAPTSSITWDYGWSVMKPEHDHVGFPRDGTCPSGQTCPSVPPPSTMPAVTPAEVLASLANHPTVVQFFDSANGTTNPATGDSTMPGTVAVPSSCVGESPAACETDLTNAGFTAAPNVVTLSDTAADLTKPAGAVVTTGPAPGADVDTSTSITLNVNPDPLPSPAEVALDNPNTTKSQTTTEVLDQCGTPLWHYTDPTSAAQIYNSNSLISSDENPPYPSGAYSTTIAPVQPGWTQSTLSAHLFQNSSQPSSAWVLFCSNQNAEFTTPVPGASVGSPEPGDPPGSGQSDYWYAPGPGGQLIMVYPQAWGPTGLPAN